VQEGLNQRIPKLYGSSYHRYKKSGEWPFYVDEKGTMSAAAGGWYLDFHVKGKAGKWKVRFTGIWQVLPNNKDWQHPIPQSKGRLIFMRERDTISGIRFPAKEKRKLASDIEVYFNASPPRLDKNGNFIDAELHCILGLVAQRSRKSLKLP